MVKFDGETALFYTSSIIQPRRVGTRGEREAASILQHKLEELGFQVEQQPFTSVNFHSQRIVFHVLIRVLPLIAIILLSLQSHWSATILALLLIMSQRLY